MEKQYTPSLSLCEALSELDRLHESENINKDSVFKRGRKYDSLEDTYTSEGELSTGLRTDLDFINDSIEENQVSFIILANLFDIYINNRNLINKTDTPVVMEIWQKLKRIIENKENTNSETIEMSWHKKLQYYYNAYVTEEAVIKAIPDLQYGTSAEEHETLYCNRTAEDAPDFTNFTFQGIPMTLEVKNYGSPDSEGKAIYSDDRTNFHGADFILYYLMSQKKWRLAYNSKDTKIYQFYNIPLQKPHINIELGRDNKFIISEWN